MIKKLLTYSLIFFCLSTQVFSLTTQDSTNTGRVSGGSLIGDRDESGDDSGLPGGEETTVTADIEASRTTCVSPCTVLFSAIGTTDTANVDANQRYFDLGYKFSFDDSTSGTFATTGLSKNIQTGGPMAAHTFYCDSSHPNYSAGQCTFNVGVRAQNTDNDFDDDFITVTVDTPEHRYSSADIICVSTSSTYTGDTPCPSGATQVTTVPTDFDGKWVLFRKGETFSGDVCVKYTDSTVLMTPFGNDADDLPEFTGSFHIGVDNACGDFVPDSDAEITGTYPEDWAKDITVTQLRVGNLTLGMSYRDVELNRMDGDYYSESDGGIYILNSATNYCLNNEEISCGNVKYPRGLYLSENTVIGSESAVSASPSSNGGGPLVNFGAFNCPVINWIAVIGNTAWNSDEHNFRTEGYWRGVFAHNEFKGHHHASGGKHALTNRACGNGADMDPESLVYRHTGAGSTNSSPVTRYGVIADNLLGSSDSTRSSWKLHVAPTNSGSAESIYNVVIERNTILNNPSDSSQDMRISGKYIEARTDNIYSPEQADCTIGPRDAIPTEDYGNLDCSADVPPVPSTPGS